MKRIFSAVLLGMLMFSSALASAFTVPASGTIETNFSPNEGGEELVLKVINSAKNEIKMLSYSFTSVPVTDALVTAQGRGVKVSLVADFHGNLSKSSQLAFHKLMTAGCEVKTISVYTIHHDKVIIVDGTTVEQGSFNYSYSAEHKNSENVLVNWNNPALAAIFMSHFNRNYNQAEEFK